eukprot:351572-Chlamydomonas_euryale.AAC.4
MAVGRDRFRADAVKVMQLLQQLQASEMDTDDPTLGYMLQVQRVWREGGGMNFLWNRLHAQARPPLAFMLQLESVCVGVGVWGGVGGKGEQIAAAPVWRPQQKDDHTLDCMPQARNRCNPCLADADVPRN